MIEDLLPTHFKALSCKNIVPFRRQIACIVREDAKNVPSAPLRRQIICHFSPEAKEDAKNVLLASILTFYRERPTLFERIIQI